MAETQKIKDKLTAARSALMATVEDLEGAQWDWQPGDGRWSARLTLGHVASAQWSHLEVARRALAGQKVDLPGFDLDAWNNARAAERADWSLEQVLVDLEAAQRATFAFVNSLDEGHLAIRNEHPALGDVTIRQVLRIIALHDNLHRRDILTLLAEMGSPA